MRRSSALVLYALVFLLAGAGLVSAEPLKPLKFKEFGILSTYARADLAEKDDYEFVPLIVRLGYDLDERGLGFPDIVASAAKLFGKDDLRIPGYTEFMFEPFAGAVFSPDRNMEAGLLVAIKYAYPVTARFHLYTFGGGGVIYLTQHTREQSTQWNFTPQVGTGFSFLIKDSLYLNFEYRYRHFSNAGLKEPNDGVNVRMFLAGISKLY